MDYNKIFTVILFVFFIIGCKDVNNDLDIDVVRFEKQFYNSDEKQLDNLIYKYPFLFPSQFPKSNWINKINDSVEISLYNKSIIEFKDYDFSSLKLKSIFNNRLYTMPVPSCPTDSELKLIKTIIKKKRH